MTAAQSRTNDRAEAELGASAQSIVEEIERDPGKPRARLFADLFARLLGPEAPPVLLEHRQDVLIDPESSRREGIASISSSLWRRLLQLDALDAARAHVLSEVLAALLDAPAVLYYFEYEANARGHSSAAAIFASALDARFPAFRSQADGMLITLDLLRSAGVDLDGLRVELHPSGHLRRLAPRGSGKGAPTLELDARPGGGRYGETGKRGGYGFLISERYEAGHASGTLCSPWHDGDEYREAKPWLVWVLECASEIAKPR